jgi:hypothetical protein
MNFLCDSIESFETPITVTPSLLNSSLRDEKSLFSIVHPGVLSFG